MIRQRRQAIKSSHKERTQRKHTPTHRREYTAALSPGSRSTMRSRLHVRSRSGKSTK